MSARILVVDDEADVEALFRQQFRREIRDGRFRMDFARSAAEALFTKPIDFLAFRNDIEARVKNVGLIVANEDFRRTR